MFISRYFALLGQDISFTESAIFSQTGCKKNASCGKCVNMGTRSTELNKITHGCDPHAPEIPFMPSIVQFAVYDSGENQSKPLFLEKSPFSRFHLHAYGFKQREIETLIYRVKWVNHI